MFSVDADDGIVVLVTSSFAVLPIKDDGIGVRHTGRKSFGAKWDGSIPERISHFAVGDGIEEDEDSDSSR